MPETRDHDAAIWLLTMGDTRIRVHPLPAVQQRLCHRETLRDVADRSLSASFNQPNGFSLELFRVPLALSHLVDPSRG